VGCDSREAHHAAASRTGVARVSSIRSNNKLCGNLQVDFLRCCLYVSWLEVLQLTRLIVRLQRHDSFHFLCLPTEPVMAHTAPLLQGWWEQLGAGSCQGPLKPATSRPTNPTTTTRNNSCMHQI